MNYINIKNELDALLEGDVSINELEREKYATDWSLFKITPSMVVYPKTAEDIQRLVSFINTFNKTTDEKLSVTARAAGSGMSGGSLNHSIILDVTKYLHNFKGIVKGDFGTQEHHKNFPYSITGMATAEPGMKYIPFENETVKEGMIMPTYPASRKLCAIGGMVANNGAGEKSLKYGQNKDFVHSLKVILADGNEYEIKPMSFKEMTEKTKDNDYLGNIINEVYSLIKDNWSLIQEKRPKTSKNAAGYLLWDVISTHSIDEFESGKGHFDLTKLFVGAQGTTGIISEICYKLVPLEEKTEMLVMFVNDINELPEIVRVLEDYDLETIELYDDHTFKIGVKFFGDFIKDKGFFKAIRYALRFLPEFKMAMTGGIPKFIVLAENVAKTKETVHQESVSELKAIQERLPSLRSFIVDNEKEAQKYWDFRHDSFKLLTEHSMKSRKEQSGTRTAPFIDDIAVPPASLPEYIPKLVAILDEYKDEFMYTIAGHLGNGNFHIIPLVDMNKQENKDNIIEISERVYELALSYGGTITAEHNDGIVRTPFLKDMFGEDMINLFSKVKTIFDPTNIFNPGKKVGLKKEDIQKYLA
jgi:FAD/FMN-containing dehydrogenase